MKSTKEEQQKRINSLMRESERSLGSAEISEGEQSFRLEVGTALRYALQIKKLDTKKIENDEEMIERLNQFLVTCVESGQIPTIEKACLALGISTGELRKFKYGEKKFSNQTQRIVEDLYTTCSAISGEMAMKGKINPVVYIFQAKNYYDMSDNQQITITANNALDVNNDKKAIEEKYAELPNDD